MRSEYIRRMGVALCVSSALAACTTETKKDAVVADTTMNRDLNLARRDTAPQPQLRDVPAAGAPAPVAQTTTTTTTTRRTTTTPAAPMTTARAVAPRPAPAPKTTRSGNTVTRTDAGSSTSAGGAVASIPSGTAFDLTSSSRICTNTATAGQTFTAMTSAATTAGGVTIPAGATAAVRVIDLKKSSGSNDAIVITLAVTSLSWGGKTYPISSEVTFAQVDRVRNESTSSDVGKVVGGAVVGAAIGQILGKNTQSTVIGAATGAAAGTAIAMGTANYEGCIPAGGRIAIKLTSPATVRAE